MKLKLVVVMIVVLMLSSVPGFMATGAEYTEHAEILNELGLFNGTNNGFELERAPKRVEVAAMLVKFLGAEEEANLKKYSHPFTDVPAWADNLIGYMYEKGLTTGIGNNLFGSNKLASSRDYTVFVLKALGYDSTDFSYSDTMNFAVQKGLISADEKSNVEASTFTRGAMVYLSYRSLFTDIKSGTMTLGDKLGKNDIEIVKSPEKVTITRTLTEDGKAYTYIIDKETLPAPFNEFVYFLTTGVSWTMPTDSTVLEFLVPGLKKDSLQSNRPFEGKGEFGKSLNTVCLLFDADKKVIGYFDLINNDQTGKIVVEMKEPTPFEMRLPVISTGISLNAKGEIIIDREKLPVLMKSYSKALMLTNAPSNDNKIEFMGNYSIMDKYNTTITTNGTLSPLKTKDIIGKEICVYLYDANNKCIGYKKLDSQPLIPLMEAEIDKKGIINIDSGLVYHSDMHLNVYPILPELRKQLNQPYSIGVMSGASSFNPTAVLYYHLIDGKSDFELGYDGCTSTGMNESNGSFVSIYNKENELLGYHMISQSDLTQRQELLKTVTVHLAEPYSEGLNAGHFTVNYYINGVLDPASARSGGSSKVLLDDQEKIIGVELHEIFYMPEIGMEIKVESKVPGVTVESFEID